MKTPSRPAALFSVLYEDNHLLVVHKPAGLLTQADRSGEVSLLELGKAWLKEKYNKPGNVFLGMVHRLDRPVSGVMVLAKTSKAASRLSEQFRGREVRKLYLARVEGKVEPEAAQWTHFVTRVGDTTVASVIPQEGAQRASLSYRRLSGEEDQTLVEVELQTGRKHQIRSQFSAMGHPIVGDFRYGAKTPFKENAIALVSVHLEFQHPTLPESRIVVPLPNALNPLQGDA